jgi:hypothetical protein
VGEEDSRYSFNANIEGGDLPQIWTTAWNA